MLELIIDENFKPPEKTFVFTASSLNLHRRDKNVKFRRYILEAIENGKVNAVITPLELAKLERYVGEENYYKTYLPVLHSSRSRVFRMKIDLDAKRSLNCYYQLFNPFLGMRAAELSSIIASIELMLPLITDDYHHLGIQQKVIKAYQTRHKERIDDSLAGKEKRKCFEMYTSQDFYKRFLSKV
jgi:hypothetical protein